MGRRSKEFKVPFPVLMRGTTTPVIVKSLQSEDYDQHGRFINVRIISSNVSGLHPELNEALEFFQDIEGVRWRYHSKPGDHSVLCKEVVEEGKKGVP